MHVAVLMAGLTGRIAEALLLGIWPNSQRVGSYLTIRCEGIMKNRVHFEYRSLSRSPAVPSGITHMTRISDTSGSFDPSSFHASLNSPCSDKSRKGVRKQGGYDVMIPTEPNARLRTENCARGFRIALDSPDPLVDNRQGRIAIQRARIKVEKETEPSRHVSRVCVVSGN